MPSFKKLSISIHTPTGPLPSLHHEETSDSSCSSYIMSQPNLSFWVSIAPEPGLIPRRRKVSNIKKVQQWHLLVEVFLDGRKAPVAATIVRLPWEGYRLEEYMLRPQGEQQWTFKDVGLEGIFEALSVVEEADEVLDGEEENLNMLLERMQKFYSKGKGKESVQSEGETPQVKIVVSKVILSGSFFDATYALGCASGSEAMQKSNETARDISPGKMAFSWRPYSPTEPQYATFTFYYRGEKQMRQLGFLDAPEASRKKIDKVLPLFALLPLSRNPTPSSSDYEDSDTSIKSDEESDSNTCIDLASPTSSGSSTWFEISNILDPNDIEMERRCMAQGYKVLYFLLKCTFGRRRELTGGEYLKRGYDEIDCWEEPSAHPKWRPMTVKRTRNAEKDDGDEVLPWEV